MKHDKTIFRCKITGMDFVVPEHSKLSFGVYEKNTEFNFRVSTKNVKDLKIITSKLKEKEIF
jgi:hypothetical protein